MPIMDRQDEQGFENRRSPSDQRKGEMEEAAVRRRLISGGLSAAPILLAFKSQSALAQVACQTPSGAMSGNLSQGNQLVGECGGTGPTSTGTFVAGGSTATFSALTVSGPSAPPWPPSITPPVLQQYTTSGGGSNLTWVDVTFKLSPVARPYFVWTSNSDLTSGKLRVKGTTDAAFGAIFASIFGDATGILVPLLPTPPSTNSNEKNNGSVSSARPVSLFEVLWFPAETSIAYGQLAQYCVAAYFYAMLHPGTYAVTANQVKDIWYDIAVMKSKYCALSTCGQNGGWDASQAVTYLGSTFSTP